MQPIETFAVDTVLVSIYPDDTAGDGPRDWDNLGKLYLPALDICETDIARRSGYARWDDDQEIRFAARYAGIFQGAEYVALQFQDYGSSGQRLLTYEPGEELGSANSILIADRETIVREYGDDSPRSRETARRCLIGEAQTLDQWLQGDVYGYVIKTADGTHLESCWGFYGIDETMSEARAVAESCARDEQDEQRWAAAQGIPTLT